MTADDQFGADYFQRLQSASGHWWVRGMQLVGSALLGEEASNLDVLDAGCGSGALLPWLGQLAHPGEVVAVDVARAAVERVHALALPVDVALASVTDLPLRDASFDLVVSMDVLQHLTARGAQGAVSEMARVLKPGGRALVRTNAAFGRGHVAERDDWRLYRVEMLGADLRNAGLEVRALTPVNAVQALWASVAARRRRRSPRGATTATEAHREEWGTAGLGIPGPVHPVVNAVLLGLLRAEARWLARPGRRLPFGHSLYAVARRPDAVSDRG